MQRKGDMDAGADPSQMRLQIYPRRKAGQKHKDSRTGAAVVVTLEVLHGFADIPLVHAAKKLGISKTALKSACRTLGLERWPFRRPPEETKAKAKAESSGKKRAAGGGFRGAGAGLGASSGKGKGRKRQKVCGPKASAGKGGKNHAQEKEAVEEDEEQQFREDCPHEEDADSGFEDVDSSHDLDDHVSDNQDDELDDRHGVALGELVHEERRREEDWGSGTEGGEGGTSSNGARDTSEKTSGDESGGRSSGDEGSGAAGYPVSLPINDLSWMTNGDAALEAFGATHALDDVGLHPIIIKPGAQYPAEGDSSRASLNTQPTLPSSQEPWSTSDDTSRSISPEYPVHMLGTSIWPECNAVMQGFLQPNLYHNPGYMLDASSPSRPAPRHHLLAALDAASREYRPFFSNSQHHRHMPLHPVTDASMDVFRLDRDRHFDFAWGQRAHHMHLQAAIERERAVREMSLHGPMASVLSRALGPGAL